MGETEYEAVDGIICPATSNVININKLGNKMATPPATPEAVEALARALSKHVEVPSTGFLEVDPGVVANNACFDIAEAILTGSITLLGLVPAAQVAEAVAAEREAAKNAAAKQRADQMAAGDKKAIEYIKLRRAGFIYKEIAASVGVTASAIRDQIERFVTRRVKQKPTKSFLTLWGISSVKLRVVRLMRRLDISARRARRARKSLELDALFDSEIAAAIRERGEA